MATPRSFSWVDAPLLAASAYPYNDDELRWLRGQGVDIILTLTEDALPRESIDQAGLMSVHVPIEDMSAPTLAQIEQCLQTIEKARESKMGVNVHCLYGKGRTGTILAAYLISRGMPVHQAIERIREERPGSIETYHQEMRLHEFAESRGR